MNWIMFLLLGVFFASSPVNGYVVEKSLDTANGVLGFTLVCFGELGSIPLLLAEDGVSFSTETGFEFALEDPASSSKKISELVEAPRGISRSGGALGNLHRGCNQ